MKKYPTHRFVIIMALLLGVCAIGHIAASVTKASEPSEFDLQLPEGESTLQKTFTVSKSGPCWIRVGGLRAGGAVSVELDGKPVDGELFAKTGAGPASHWNYKVTLAEGAHKLVVREEPGLQFYRVEGTRRYLATGTEYAGHSVLKYDAANRNKKYPVELRFGSDFEAFFWFSGKWDRTHYKPMAEIRNFRTTSGVKEASLSFECLHPPLNMLMPVKYTLRRDAETHNVIVHVRQNLEFTGPCTFTDKDTLQFIHVVIDRRYGRDWGDGIPDYFWNREQVDVDNDTLQGTRTHFALMDDNSRRGWSFHSDTSNPDVVTTLPAKYPFGHHTSFGHPLYAENTIGGWFTKTGTGSVGWVMHKYRDNFAKDMWPIHSHCGDGADTHIYAGWNRFYFPWKRKAGDRLDVEYSFQCLPSEVLREEVELINEYDLVFFGEERQAKSKIVKWYGTKDACGLIRGDGSVVLLGLSRRPPSHYTIPENVRGKVQRTFRLSDLRSCNYTQEPVKEGRVKVLPGCVTIVDCGSALEGPQKK